MSVSYFWGELGHLFVLLSFVSAGAFGGGCAYAQPPPTPPTLPRFSTDKAFFHHARGQSGGHSVLPLRSAVSGTVRLLLRVEPQLRTSAHRIQSILSLGRTRRFFSTMDAFSRAHYGRLASDASCASLRGLESLSCDAATVVQHAAGHRTWWRVCGEFTLFADQRHGELAYFSD